MLGVQICPLEARYLGRRVQKCEFIFFVISGEDVQNIRFFLSESSFFKKKKDVKKRKITDGLSQLHIPAPTW